MALVDAARFPGDYAEAGMSVGNINSKAVDAIFLAPVIDARESDAEGQSGLNIDGSQRAASRLHAYSISHVGDKIAIVVNGRIVMVLQMLDPLKRRGFWISPMDANAAANTARALRMCRRGL